MVGVDVGGGGVRRAGGEEEDDKEEMDELAMVMCGD